jgi:hypothetical protein
MKISKYEDIKRENLESRNGNDVQVRHAVMDDTRMDGSYDANEPYVVRSTRLKLWRAVQLGEYNSKKTKKLRPSIKAREVCWMITVTDMSTKEVLFPILLLAMLMLGSCSKKIATNDIKP